MNTPNPATPNSATPKPRASAWRQTALALGFITGGFALGAASLAFAHGDMPFHGGWQHGARVGFFQHMVRGALDNVGASTAQEDKIHDIIAATYTDFEKGKGDREAMRKQLFELMKAPTIDRAAIEKLRAEKIADIDAKSKKVVNALLDAAGQLTPDQRGKLVQQAQERMEHHGWGGWRHGGEPDGEHHHHDHDGGPDDGDNHG